MTIIVWDVESTGLLAPLAAGQEQQPYLVEIAAVKLNRQFELIENLFLRCKPPISIPAEASKVHGIIDRDVMDSRSFVEILPVITKFFLGSEYQVGHNIMFDKMVLYWELFRCGKTLDFPWPPNTICTVEASLQINGWRMNLGDLHMHLFGMSFEGAHTASVDVEITRKCFVEMAKREMVQL